MQKLWVIAILVLLVTIPATVIAGSDPPARPPVFGGTVTLGGTPIADGVTISAWIGETLVAYYHAKDSAYAFMIAQPPGETYEGRMITFRIGRQEAQQIDIWNADGGRERNLTGLRE